MKPSKPVLALFAFVLLASVLLLTESAAAATEGNVVLGPTKNTRLQDGASALMVGNAEDGVRLTLEGLNVARGTREKRSALSNLCAGYLMLELLDKALFYCNEALSFTENNWRAYNNRALIYVLQERFEEAEQDLQTCERIHPNARQTRMVRRILRDQIDPVVPVIVVDDRRLARQTGVDNE